MKPEIIVDVMQRGARIVVTRRPSRIDPEKWFYDVTKSVAGGSETKHPNCDAEDVMRVLGHYINDSIGR